MARLFETVNSKGDIVPTSGTYTIARREKEQQIAIFTNSYSDGVAEDTGVFQQGDVIFIYPNNFVGTSTNKSGSKVQLNENALREAIQRKAAAIGTRYMPNPPKP